jgi:hypothetical protein
VGPNSGIPLIVEPDEAEAFWERVDKSGDCWLWMGRKNSGGYGHTSLRCRKPVPVVAHRVAWTIANGRTIPRGMCVLHECDNPPCVNPAHLKLGSHQENMHDAAARGRMTGRNQGANQTHCKRGHLYGPPSSDGYRVCDKCKKLQAAQEAAQRTAMWQERAAVFFAPLIPQDESDLLNGLNGLKFREAAFLKAYFGLYGHEVMELQQMADLWGITRERVRQIRNRALEKLGTDIEATETAIGNVWTQSQAA